MKTPSDKSPPRAARKSVKGERRVSAEDAVEEVLTRAKEYLRDHPWIAVAGAAVIGGAINALAEHERMPGPAKNVKTVNKWVNDAYAKLPTQRQIRSMAKSTGLTGFVEKLKS